MSGEMSGKPGLKLTSITHEHSFSSHMMVSCYSKIFKELGLGMINGLALGLLIALLPECAGWGDHGAY